MLMTLMLNIVCVYLFAFYFTIFFFFIFVGVHFVDLWFPHWIPKWLHFIVFFLFSSAPPTSSSSAPFSLALTLIPTHPQELPSTYLCFFLIFLFFVGYKATKREFCWAETILVADKPLYVNQFSIQRIFSDYLKCVFPVNGWYLNGCVDKVRII